jgi:4-methyl-5(b-hydroxyethyl)-thiazole monophosphate biosynthesis
MPSVLVPLAQGCEELEAVSITDLLTRAGVKVITAGLDDQPVHASRGITFIPDVQISEVANQTFDMIVLPGGQPGADHLRDNVTLQTILKQHAADNKYLAAICAAPRVLAHLGLLENKRATSYPGALDAAALKNTQLKSTPIEMDGKIITSRGPGTAMDFALQLIELLVDKDTRQQVEKGLAR